MWTKIHYLLRRFIFIRSFTPRRFFNYVLVTFQKKVTKNSYVIGYPYEVILDSTSICNLRCPLCPTGQKREERSQGKMTFAQFKTVIDEIGPYIYELDMFNWGEPFVNNDVYDMIAYAHRKRISVKISSNFNLMDEARAERIVRSGLDILGVSLDGGSPETYAQYRVGGKFEKVINNIRMVIEAKKRLKSETPRLVWQFIVMRHNEHEIEQARQHSQELGMDEFVLSQVRSDMGREIFQNDAEKILSVENWLPENEVYSRYDYASKQRKVRHQTCWYPYTMAVINWNGSVSPCCAVWEETYDFGNMFNSSFKTIWNGSMYRASRRVVSGKAIPEDDQMDLICARCKLNGFVDH